MATMIRFVVLYNPNKLPEHLVQKVILGVGFTQNGYVHYDLLSVYAPDRLVSDTPKAKEGVYAGYLYVDEKTGSIHLYEKGGSSTLGITQTQEEDKAFLDVIERNEKLKKAIANLYPLIASSQVANVMLFAVQKASD